MSSNRSPRTTHLYHGTRAALRPGDSVAPASPGPDAAPCVFLTPSLDEAIWDAELAPGDGDGRVYEVEPLGEIVASRDLAERGPAGHPTMSWCSEAPLRVVAEVTEWPLYHGTRAALAPGDLIAPGQVPNFGDRTRATTWVYCSRTLDAATWGAELAVGEGPGRIYRVEPTGPLEEDPNLTDRKFRGNPTKSFRSRAPLRVVGEVVEWQGHAPETVQAMKEGVARLAAQGVGPEDD